MPVLSLVRHLSNISCPSISSALSQFTVPFSSLLFLREFFVVRFLSFSLLDLGLFRNGADQNPASVP